MGNPEVQRYVAIGDQMGLLKILGQGPAPLFLPIYIYAAHPAPPYTHQHKQSIHLWLSWELASLPFIHTVLLGSRSWNARLPLRELACGPPQP